MKVRVYPKECPYCCGGGTAVTEHGERLVCEICEGRGRIFLDEPRVVFWPQFVVRVNLSKLFVILVHSLALLGLLLFISLPLACQYVNHHAPAWVTRTELRSGELVKAEAVETVTAMVMAAVAVALIVYFCAFCIPETKSKAKRTQ